MKKNIEEDEDNNLTYGGSSELGEPPRSVLSVINTNGKAYCRQCDSNGVCRCDNNVQDLLNNVRRYKTVIMRVYDKDELDPDSFYNVDLDGDNDDFEELDEVFYKTNDPVKDYDSYQNSLDKEIEYDSDTQKFMIQFMSKLHFLVVKLKSDKDILRNSLDKSVKEVRKAFQIEFDEYDPDELEESSRELFGVTMNDLNDIVQSLLVSLEKNSQLNINRYVNKLCSLIVVNFQLMNEVDPTIEKDDFRHFNIKKIGA